MLDRQDILLLIARGADGGQFPLDPIRIMKGCFLVAQLGKSDWKSLFQFEPYAYGPFDSSVYEARNTLASKGMLSISGNGRYPTYSLTPEGQARVAELHQKIPAAEINWLTEIGKYITSKSFIGLLDEIYDKFPEYTTRSRLRGK